MSSKRTKFNSARDIGPSPKFNGGHLADWMIAKENLIHLAKDNKIHLEYRPEHFVNGAIIEEQFRGTRICPAGQEETFVQDEIDTLTEEMEQINGDKIAEIRRRLAGNANRDERDAEIAKVNIELREKTFNLKSQKTKKIMDAQASGARFDQQKRDFNDARGDVINLLKKSLGDNLKGMIAGMLREERPRAAWHHLCTYYERQATNSTHTTNVTSQMASLTFSRQQGNAAHHAAALDRLNLTLEAAGEQKPDGAIMNYLAAAIRRSSDASIYAEALSIAKYSQFTRQQTMDALEQAEMEQAGRESKGRVAGANYGEVTREFAGAAGHVKKKKRKFNETANVAAGPPVKQASVFECKKCGGPHKGKDCTVQVVCKRCNSKNHSIKFCWIEHPEQKPANFTPKVPN